MSIIVIAIIIVAAIGLIAGIGLSFASVALEVPTDERVEKARELLPGANCGGCGFSGCDAYAEAVINGKADSTLCAPGGADVARGLAEILGVDAGDFQEKLACVRCNGGCENTEKKYEYRGIKSCAAVTTLFSGDNSCSFGCLGLGDCVNVCPSGAIKINSNGVAEIDNSECTGCGACANACPKGIINIVPKVPGTYSVACNNKDKGAIARKVCKVSCIGCGICKKQCEAEAITIEDNLATINPLLCTGCGKCADKCPQKCIVKA